MSVGYLDAKNKGQKTLENGMQLVKTSRKRKDKRRHLVGCSSKQPEPHIPGRSPYPDQQSQSCENNPTSSPKCQ